MSFNALLQNNFNATAITINGVTATSIAAGPSQVMQDVTPGTLSATCVVTADTSTITLSAVWEGSDDGGTTWKRLVSENNVAPTVLATGTGGADAAVTRVVSAPAAAYGWRAVRCSILVGVTTGASIDLATVGYNYCKTKFI